MGGCLISDPRLLGLTLMAVPALGFLGTTSETLHAIFEQSGVSEEEYALAKAKILA